MHALKKDSACTHPWKAAHAHTSHHRGTGSTGSRAAMKPAMKRSVLKSEACACAAAAMGSLSDWSMMISCERARVHGQGSMQACVCV